MANAMSDMRQGAVADDDRLGIEAWQRLQQNVHAFVANEPSDEQQDRPERDALRIACTRVPVTPDSRYRVRLETVRNHGALARYGARAGTSQHRRRGHDDPHGAAKREIEQRLIEQPVLPAADGSLRCGYQTISGCARTGDRQ